MLLEFCLALPPVMTRAIDWKALKRVLRYLKQHPNLGIEFDTDGELNAFTDSSYADCKVTRRSTSGSVIMFRGGPIYWNSSLQKAVTLSTTEAEYVACCKAASPFGII